MFLNSQNIELEKTGSLTTVPNDPVSKLRYFFHCMCNVVPTLDENGQYSQIRNFQNYLSLNNNQIDAVIELCKACFAALDDKCIFLAPQLCQ